MALWKNSFGYGSEATSPCFSSTLPARMAESLRLTASSSIVCETSTPAVSPPVALLAINSMPISVHGQNRSRRLYGSSE